MFWISSALCGRLSPLGRKGRSLCWTSALLRMGAIISGVHTLARSTAEGDQSCECLRSLSEAHVTSLM